MRKVSILMADKYVLYLKLEEEIIWDLSGASFYLFFIQARDCLMMLLFKGKGGH